MKKYVWNAMALGLLVAMSSGCAGTKKVAGMLNGKWNITAVKGEPIGKMEKQPFLEFDATSKRVHGNAGCNIINGDYRQEAGKASSLRFPQMISTMMACPDMDTESKILNALDAVRAFKATSKDKVILLDATNKEVLVLSK